MRDPRLLLRMLRLLVLIGVMIGGPTPRDSAAYLSRIPAEFSEDGRLILVQMADALVIWDLETRAQVGQIPRAQCDQIVLLKQEGWVLCAAYGVTIYDWTRRTTVATIPPEAKNPMRVLAYSRETDRIVVRQGDEAVSVWKVGEKLVPLKHIPVEIGKGLVSFAASPDTKVLAIAEGQTIHLYDLTGTSTRDVALTDGKPRDLLFAPNSSILAASVGNTIVLLDTVAGSVHARATLTNAEGARGHLVPRVFSRDSSRLVAGNGEWSYPLFEVGTGKRLSLTELTDTERERSTRSRTKLSAVDISADGDYLVGQPEHPSTLQMWDLQTGAILPDLCGEDCRNMGLRVSLLKWSPNGSKIVVGMQGGLNPEVDGKISLWDVKARYPELVLDPSLPQAKVLVKRAVPLSANAATPSETAATPAFVHESALRALAASPTSPLLVTAGDDGLLKIWDPGRGALLRRLKLHAPASALAFSADGAILVAGTTEGDVRLWDTKTWREFPPYSSRQGSINALQLLPGNRLLVIAGGQPKVPVVDLVTRQVVKELVHTSDSDSCGQPGCERTRAAQGDIVLTVATLEGSSLLLTASQTGRVVWDTATWREIEKPAGFPDNWSALGWKRPFLSTSARTSDPNAFALTVWDPKRNGPLATLDTFTNRDVEVIDRGTTVALGTSLAIDPLNRWAATRVGEYVSVWDLSTRTKKKTFHVTMPYHLNWTSEGRHLVVSTLERKVLVWSADAMEPAHYLRDPAVTR